MGSGLVKEISGHGSRISLLKEDRLTDVESSQKSKSSKSIVGRHISAVQTYLGAYSTFTSDELTMARHYFCTESWKTITGVFHQYPDGKLVNGVDVFCMRFINNLEKNDITEDRAIFNAFQPRSGSRNVNRAAILRRMVKYLLSIRFENKEQKLKLRALGRSHARIKIERPQMEVFSESLLETLMNFPGLRISSDVVGAWASLLRFAIDQMCFDKIIFRDHITLDSAIVAQEPAPVYEKLQEFKFSTDGELSSIKTQPGGQEYMETCDSVDEDAVGDFGTISGTVSD
jgi:hemoglobin-like flavoprotein